MVKFDVGGKTYEGTILTNLSRKLANNQFEVAVRVPDTLTLGDSRIILSRKQNEKVSQNPAEPAKEVLKNSNSYRVENTTDYVFAAQWTADRIAVLNASNPELVVAATSSSDLLIGNIAVGTDDRLDRARDLTVTSDGSRVYVPLELSGRVALVDPITRQQIDTKADVAGLNPIELPSGAAPRSIVLDSRDQYAYIADGKAGGNSIYVLDINPFSSKYHQVIQTITVGAAPSGLRQMAISSDGKKLFVTAPNGINSRIYVVNIDPKDRPRDPTQNPRKWNQLIGTVTGDEGLEGLAATVDPLKMTFTNSNKDSRGFGVLDITNNEPLSFAATTRYANLGLGSDFDYFDVNEGVSVTVLPDASYAFVVGRNNNTALFTQGIASVDGDGRAGSNIGIIKDPLTNPQLVAATRPIPNGLATDLVLSGDSKYLYASYPNLTSANGRVYVFDTQEFIRTATNPGQFQIDAQGRGVGLPLFNSATARAATVADLSRFPIDNINPAVSVAADFQILSAIGDRYTYGTPSGSKGAPVVATNSRGLAATPLDWLELTGPGEETEDLTPNFEWEFNELPLQDVEEVNLFVSVFDEGEGLLPWDEIVDLSDPDGNEFLSDQGLSKPEQFDLLTKPWNTSFYRGQENDFNPNRILTATWQRDENGIGKWTLDGGKTFIDGIPKLFTLPDNRTLTAGQEYKWAVEAWNKNGSRNIDFGDFWTAPLTGLIDIDDNTLIAANDTFPSVTVLTHGFKPPFTSPFVDSPGIPSEFYQLGNSIANAGIEDNGLMMRYNPASGYWVPITKNGAVAPDFPAGDNPGNDPDYLNKLESYIAPYIAKNQPLVLLNDWSNNNESSVPDSGFSEAAADAFFTSLVQLDQLFSDEISITKQGSILNSPLHFIGFSRGTVVNSEIIQRLGTYFPEAGGRETSGVRDLQMTTLDPHDFDQPGLNVLVDNFGDFKEPKVQVWENVTFADNYYQTVPDLLGRTFSPAGRDIPNLPFTEDGKTAPGLEFPREGWRSENPDPTTPRPPLLGRPDLSVWLGTNKDHPDYQNSRAGFTKETDPILGISDGAGAVHGRVVGWYGGTSDLFPTNFPFDENLDANPIFRRRGDGYREPLFNKNFSFNSPILADSPRVSPWYTPEERFQHGADTAPWEGIGTGWFYSVLGGGKEFRKPTFVDRIPVDFENTYDARMRGDFAVPTLFNGNFDAVFNPTGLRTILSDAIPGWSLHNGETPGSVSTSNLVDVNQLSATDAPALYAELDRIGVDRTQPNYALKLESGKSITHNRFVVPEWGNLRFDLHVPEAELAQGRSVLVTLSAADGSPLGVSSSINLMRANRTKGAYLADTKKIDYGIKGFETFQFEVPDNLRGEVATLKFEVVGGGTVYLDNAFFKSQHLLFGNPSDARNTTDLAVADKNNYLLEKAQFATAYDDSKKTPKWVSWQLNKKWLSDTPRSDSTFIEDPSIPESWGRIEDGDYAGSLYSKGHLLPSSQRTNSEKDNIATFLLTNVVPQHFDNNNLFLGEIPDSPAWTSFDDFLKQITQNDPITDTSKELYVVAGGYLSNPDPQRFNHYSRPTTLTEPQILTTKGINIPGWTWNVVLDLEQPGLTPATVTVANAATYGILTPNEVEPDHVPANPDGTVGNNGDFPLPVPHPFNTLLGLSLPDIQNKAAWRNWRTWQLTINQVEDLAGLDFFSNIPDEIEEIIESEG